MKTLQDIYPVCNVSWFILWMFKLAFISFFAHMLHESHGKIIQLSPKLATKNEVPTLKKHKDRRKGLACFFKGHNVHPPSGSPLCWVRFRPAPTSCERIVVEKAWWSMPKAAPCASCFREKQMRAQVEKGDGKKPEAMKVEDLRDVKI